jgi:cobalt-zinc-cadmium efflux system outer membrane protein
MKKMAPEKSSFAVSLVATLLCGACFCARAAERPVDAPSRAAPEAGTINSPPPSRTFSLSACFDKADRFNRELLSARWNLPIAEAAIKIAGAIPNPQFELQAGFGPTFRYLYTGQTQQIGWTEELQTAGKRSKKVNLARANYELTKIQLDALRFDVHNRVRRAYAELAAAEAFEALIEAQRSVSLTLLDIAQKRFDAGKAPHTEVLQSELNVVQFDTQRNQAQSRLQQSSAALALITGEKPEKIEVIDVDDNGLFKLSAEKTEIVPSPERALPDLADLRATAFAQRLDLKAATQQVFVARKALSVARAQRVPDVFVSAGYTYAQFSQHQPPNLVPFSNWLGNGVFLGVSAENPVFYQHQGEVQQCQAALRQSSRQVDLLKSQIAADLIASYNAVQVARANIFLFQDDLLPTAAQVSKLARRGYQVGSTDLATAIVAQQQYQQVLSNYFDSVVAYQNAWADLEKAVGVPLAL